jgi:antirestriction protein ArdC
MRSATERQDMQQEALSRAVSGQSWTNYAAIYQGFVAKGIPENEILPRENVFTYHAWRALGRQVRRGEHGGKVTTFVRMDKKTGDVDPETGEEKRVSIGRRAWTAVVFHVSQTDAISK